MTPASKLKLFFVLLLSLISGSFGDGRNYLVSLHADEPFGMGETILGAGSLVTLRHVITSAYLVDRYDSRFLYILAGSNKHDEGGERRTAEHIILHPTFNVTNFHNNIAIVVLDTPFIRSDSIGTISLCSQPMAAGDKAELSGWGTTQPVEAPHNFRVILQEATHTTTTVVSKELCAEYYETCAPDYCDITESTVCATEPCGADQGSPSVNSNGELCGVYSYGFLCEMPSVYISLAHPEISNFIRENIDLANIDE